MFIRKKSQSVLEYALLIAVIIAAILIMQVFIKRGYSGRLKDSADRMGGGESYSAGSTTIRSENTMPEGDDQIIWEQTATDGTGGAAAALGQTWINSELSGSSHDYKGDAFTAQVRDVVGMDGYSSSRRSGGAVTSRTEKSTDGAAQEDFRGNVTSQGYRQDKYTRDADTEFSDDADLSF